MALPKKARASRPRPASELKRRVVRRLQGSKRGAAGSRIGDDLVEAFEEMAKHLRGEIELEAHELPRSVMTPAQIKAIRSKVASSTKEFERLFGIPARTMDLTSRDDAISTGPCGRFCVSLIANHKLLVAPSQVNIFNSRIFGYRCLAITISPFPWGRRDEPGLEEGEHAPSPAGTGEIARASQHAAARNVWLQLGFPDAEEHYLKAELVFRLDKAIKSLGLTQRVAARRIGTTQPELSKILGGKFTEVSLERLMRFLTALGYHTEIKIGAGKPIKAGEVTKSRTLAVRQREHIVSLWWKTLPRPSLALLDITQMTRSASTPATDLGGR